MQEEVKASHCAAFLEYEGWVDCGERHSSNGGGRAETQINGMGYGVVQPARFVQHHHNLLEHCVA